MASKIQPPFVWRGGEAGPKGDVEVAAAQVGKETWLLTNQGRVDKSGPIIKSRANAKAWPAHATLFFLVPLSFCYPAQLAVFAAGKNRASRTRSELASSYSLYPTFSMNYFDENTTLQAILMAVMRIGDAFEK